MKNKPAKKYKAEMVTRSWKDELKVVGEREKSALL